MQKTLHFIRDEDQKTYDDFGHLIAAYSKKFFNYLCHDVNDACQTNPVLCRTVDHLHPEIEPQWASDAPECSRCFGVNNRALEDLYLQSFN